VDGGVDESTAPLAASSGADVFVAGLPFSKSSEIPRIFFRRSPQRVSRPAC